MSRTGFEKERRWLTNLTQAGSKPALFALVGFEKNESEYLLELARDRLKTIDADLSSEIELMDEKALEKLRSFQYNLFQKSPMPLYELTNITVTEQKKWAKTLLESGLGAFIVSTSSLDVSWKAFIDPSHVLDVTEEKPWHKQDRFVDWLRAFLKSKGVEISESLGVEVVQAYAMDRRSLRSQAQLWADEKGYQGKILPEDLHLDPSYTVWKLLDDIWQRKTSDALTKLATLFKEDPSGISLSALLRQQWSSLGSYFEEGASAANKRQQQLQATAGRLGLQKWKEGIVRLHQTQIDLRSSKPPLESLERLVIKLIELQK